MKTQRIIAISCIVLGIAFIAFGIVLANHNPIPPTRTEFAEMVSQTDTTAVFITEDGNLFIADVGELLELHTNYILVFDTNKTTDRTDDEILSVSKLVK